MPGKLRWLLAIINFLFYFYTNSRIGLVIVGLVGINIQMVIVKIIIFVTRWGNLPVNGEN